MSGRSLVRTCLVAIVALVAASCGGGDEGSDTTSAPATTQAATTTAAASSGGDATTTAAPAATTTAAPEGGGGETVASGDENKATVTVGDKTYEFDVQANIVGRCDPDFFGAFWVIASLADGRDGNLEMFIIPEGNENHDETSRVDVGVQRTEDEREWRADEDGGQGAEAGVSRVSSATIEGNTVTGTASFIDIYQGDDATAEGTFTATCPAG